jgi:hypothetical protein
MSQGQHVTVWQCLLSQVQQGHAAAGLQRIAVPSAPRYQWPNAATALIRSCEIVLLPPVNMLCSNLA